MQLWVHPPARLADPLVAGELLAERSDSHRLEPFHYHVIVGHRLLLELGEPDLDPLQLFHLSPELGSNFGLSEQQDAPQLLGGDLVVDELSDLGQRHPKVAKNENPVQLGDLLGRVVAVPRDWIDTRRLQQTKLVVVPQRAHRDLPQSRNSSYPVHGGESTR